jgi:hypothetical protein
MKGKFCMLICVSMVLLWSASLFSAVSAQVLIDGHWYPINPNVTVPSGDLDVPYHSPTPKVSTPYVAPTAVVTIYITNTPPPPFVPASDSVQINPTPISASVMSTQTSTKTVFEPTLKPGSYIVPTSVLNQYSVPSQDGPSDQYASSSSILGKLNPSAMVGSLLGVYTRGEQSILNLIARLNDKVNSETVRVLIRIVLGVVGTSLIAYFAWRWKKNKE